MGGYGSGRSADRHRGKVEHGYGIPIGFVRKHWDALPYGVPIGWSCGGEPSGKAGLTRVNDKVCITYKTRRNSSEEWRLVSAYAPVVKQPCNYGGFRLWFICPRCGARVGTLYADDVVGCRHCLDLVYQSENEGMFDRLLRKRRKIEDRLGKDLERPKGMHEKTHQRLLQDYRRIDSGLEVCLGALLCRL